MNRSRKAISFFKAAGKAAMAVMIPLMLSACASPDHADMFDPSWYKNLTPEQLRAQRRADAAGGGVYLDRLVNNSVRVEGGIETHHSDHGFTAETSKGSFKWDHGHTKVAQDNFGTSLYAWDTDERGRTVIVQLDPSRTDYFDTDGYTRSEEQLRRSGSTVVKDNQCPSGRALFDRRHQMSFCLRQ